MERLVSRLGVGIVGGGYMGKAHAVAMAAVGAVFDTALRPSLEVICTTTEAGAADKARQFGFKRATSLQARKRPIMTSRWRLSPAASMFYVRSRWDSASIKAAP
jgi:ribosomal protein S9